MSHQFTKLAVCCVSLLAVATPTYAQSSDVEVLGQEEYSNTAIQYAYSWDADNDFILGYGSDTEDRHQIRLEHQQTWKYGTVYAFGDLIHAGSNLGGERDFGFPCCGDGKDTEAFGLINGTISLAKVTGKPIKVGPFKDFGLEGRVEYGTFFDYSGVGIGVSGDLNIPGFNGKGETLRLHYWRRFNDDAFVSSNFDAGGAASERYADHNFWGITARNLFEIAGRPASHQTFLRYQQQSDGGPNELQREDRLFLENEIFVYVTDRISLGVRSEYFRDAGGISFGGVESDWRPMVSIKIDLFDR